MFKGTIQKGLKSLVNAPPLGTPPSAAEKFFQCQDDSYWLCPGFSYSLELTARSIITHSLYQTTVSAESFFRLSSVLISLSLKIFPPIDRKRRK